VSWFPFTVNVHFYGGPVDGLVLPFTTDIDHYETPVLDNEEGLNLWHHYARADKNTMIYWGVF